MARVSSAGLKRVGIALGWVVLFVAIGIGGTIGMAELVPGWGGPSWFVARTGSYEVIGFGLATWIVGRLLNKYSWDRMGWHRTAWPQLGRGVLLGALHAKNPNATVFSTMNVALAAIWLSLAFFSSGGMPLAWGAHFGWNACLAILFDAPVSGYVFQAPVVEYTPGAHAWVDGGAFGPEGGIVATIALLAG